MTIRPAIAVAVLFAGGGHPPSGSAAEPVAATADDADQMDVATRVRIDQLVKSARLAAEAGKAAEALAELRTANSLVKQARGANHPDTLPILDMAADILVGNGQFTEAGTPLQRAIALRESLLADGRRVSQAELAASLALLGRVNMAQGAFAPAAEVLAKAVDHFEKVLAGDHDAILAARRALAEAQTGLGDHAAAAATLADLHGRQRSRFGAGHPDPLSTSVSLARALRWCARHDAARELLARAITEFEQAGGRRDDLPEPLARLGEIELAAGDPPAARSAWRRAWEIDRATKGQDHAATAADRLRLLGLDVLDGDHIRAHDTGAELARHLGDLAGRDDAAASAGLRVAADLLLAADDPGRAADLLRQALETDQRLHGADHPDTAADEAGLGRCLLDAGDAATARRFLEHARVTVARTRGPAHPDTLSIVAGLGAAVAAAGDRGAAEACMRTLLEHDVPWTDERTEADICRLADGLAALDEAAGDRDAGAATRLAIVALRRRQFGEAHPIVVADIVRLADARQEAGSGDDAAALYEHAITIAEQARGPDHPDVAAILTSLARSYRGIGTNDLAEKALSRAVTIWEKTLGGTHPATLATLKTLALVRLGLRDEAGALPLMERLLAAYDADPRSDQGDVARLLKRLSQVHEARGDRAQARAALERATEIDLALGSTPAAAGAPAADASRLQKMLTFDEDAAVGLARARGIAHDLDAARERIARSGRPSPARTADDSLAAADMQAGGRSAADVAADLPDAETVVTAAWARYRAGRPEEALGMVREAAQQMEATIRTLDPPRRSDLALLSATAADMRPQVLAWDEASRLYERAALLDAEALGDGHPAALRRTLALADVRRARGDTKLADALLAMVAARLPTAVREATPSQAEQLGAAIEGSTRVALAAGHRDAAVTMLDLLLAGWGDDARLVTFALDALAIAPDDAIAAKPADAILARAVQVATRLGKIDPAIAGLALHAAARGAEDAGDTKEAERSLGRALEHDRRVFGQAHPRVALHLLALADCAARRADAAAAEDLVAEVGGIQARADRAGAAAVPDLRRLAARRLARREFTDASRVLAAALAAETKGRSGDPRTLAGIAAESGLVTASRGAAERAEELLSEAVSLAQTSLGAGAGDTVAHAVRRGRLSGDKEQSAAVAATAAGNAADTPVGSTLAGVLAENARAIRRPVPGDGRRGSRRGRDDTTAADGGADSAADAAMAVDSSPAAPAAERVASSAQADKARRALDAATRLYGGDPKKRKKEGSGRQGLESIIAYSSMVETLADNPDARLPIATTDTPRAAARPSAGPAPAAAPPRDRLPAAATHDPSPTPPISRPAPFVAASKSGLRQRTAIARTRAAGAEQKTVTVEALMRAAWSSHANGSGDDAATACDQAVALATRESGETSPQLAEVLDQSAAIAIAQGDYARGKARLERLGSLLWKLHGPADPRVADVALRLAAVLAECGEFEKARPLCDRALPGDLEQPGGDPQFHARVSIVRARIELGQGDPAAALRSARRAARLIADAWDHGDRAATGDGPLVRLRLATARLLVDVGDVEQARDEVDGICLALESGRPLAARLVEAIFAEAARTRRLDGDAVGAVGVATQAVAMVRRTHKPGVSTAAQLVELALSRRAASDASWEDPAREASRILAAAARRMTSANCDPAAIESLHGIGSEWLWAGRTDRAFDACSAAQLAAAALPPTHPTAVKVARLAARIALANGDAPRAESLLAAAHATRGRPVAPLGTGRQDDFLGIALDASARDALARRLESGRVSGSGPARSPGGALGPPASPPAAKPAASVRARP